MELEALSYGNFGGPEALAAIESHVLTQASWVGAYTLNPALEA